MMMTELTEFSVIVPVYNGAETLDRCLTALINQNYPQDLYEIIVVNDGSTDSTAVIAAKYPVQLINLATNQGRIVARNTGAAVAKFDTLVFNDVRVAAEVDLLTKLNLRNYEPVIPQVEVYNGSQWGFDRFFHLLRWRIYGDYYHSADSGIQDYWIDSGNFEDRPKGTTLFVCHKQLWLSSQPCKTDKDVNDDTRILREIVKHRPILKAGEVKAIYQHRTKITNVIQHTFERGPRFADYYLNKSGRYKDLYTFLLTGSIVTAMFFIFQGTRFFVKMVKLGLLMMGMLALYLSRRPTDLIVVTLCFPLVIVSFGLGILKWQVNQILPVRTIAIKQSETGG